MIERIGGKISNVLVHRNQEQAELNLALEYAEILGYTYIAASACAASQVVKKKEKKAQLAKLAAPLAPTQTGRSSVPGSGRTYLLSL